MDNRKIEWDRSYEKKDNFVFYPHEEVIRFVAKYIRKRVGRQEFVERCSLGRSPRILDLGCGIGRHVKFSQEMGLEAYGINLSGAALTMARELLKEYLPDPEIRIKQGDIRQLPWPEDFFDFIISHGVLDSMPFAMAKEAIKEVHRVLSPTGLFYCDLVSGADCDHAREYCGEQIVKTEHEINTMQSYFNYTKIGELCSGYFKVVEAVLTSRENVLQLSSNARYHLVLSPLETRCL